MHAPSQPDRLAIAATLREIRDILQVQGGNPFRAKAYGRAANALESFAGDLARLVEEGRLTEIPGIGPAIAAVVKELHGTGRSAMLEKLRVEMPAGTLELAQVPGLTPRRRELLREGLGIRDLAGLKTACESHRVRTLKGFGAKTEEKILEAIRAYEVEDEEVLLVDALESALPLLDHLRAGPCERAELSGPLRRRHELVRELDLVAAAGDAPALARHVARFPPVARVESEDGGAVVVRLANGHRARVVIVEPDGFAEAWLSGTGSDAHVARVATLREERRGGRRAAPAKPRRGRDAGAREPEKSLYRAAGLPFIPAELREDAGEIEAALEGDAFADLVDLDDVQGMVHCHTTYSDGKSSIEQMARGAEAMGMKYLTITDHSPTAGYAGGVEVDRLRRQWDEIAEVQERVGVRLLRGTESDILADGALDYPDRILEQMDVVVASIHNRHKLDEDKMTARVVRAMRHPLFKIWGHALGRLVGRRPPIPCRVPEVLDAIAESRAAVEINGDPYRLDMEPRWIREARKRSIPFVISTDAHTVGQMQNLHFGVAMARRGGVRRGEVLNAAGADEFRATVRPAGAAAPGAVPKRRRAAGT